MAKREPEHLGTSAACRRLGCSARTLRRWSHRLGIRPGSVWGVHGREYEWTQGDIEKIETAREEDQARRAGGAGVSDQGGAGGAASVSDQGAAPVHGPTNGNGNGSALSIPPEAFKVLREILADAIAEAAERFQREETPAPVRFDQTAPGRIALLLVCASIIAGIVFASGLLAVRFILGGG